MTAVVVTGYGLVTPLGIGVDQTWRALSQSQSGIRRIDDDAPYFDAISSKIAGQIWDYHPLTYFDKKSLRRFDPFVQYALIAVREAMQMAGLTNFDPGLDLTRAGVFMGSGIGGLHTIQNETKKLHVQGADKISPFFTRIFNQHGFRLCFARNRI